MKHNLIIWAVLAVGCLAACSKDSEDEPTTTTPTNPAERKLIVKVSETPWVNQDGKARETRGSVITTQTLTSFSMHYNTDNYSVSRNSVNSEWSTDPNTWPVSDNTSVSFYAHTAGTYNYIESSGDRYVSFTADENAQKTYDLLVSKIENVTYSGTKGVIWFTFDHACAAVDFNIKMTDALFEKRKSSLNVNKVELQHIAKTGEYRFATNEWSVGGVYTNYTLTSGDMTVTTDLQPLHCGTMFFIPQEFSDNNTKLVITYDTDKTAEISLNGIKWEAGTYYPVDIVLGTSLIQ